MGITALGQKAGTPRDMQYGKRLGGVDGQIALGACL